MSSTMWQWVIKDFVHDTSKHRMHSAKFVHDSHKVFMSAVKTKKVDKGETLGLHVCLPDAAKLSSDKGIGLVSQITLVHQKDRAFNIYSKSELCFYTSSYDSWGWKAFIDVDEAAKPERGFVSEDGELLVELQLFPITSFLWKLEDFANCIEKRTSPAFTIGGNQWQVGLYPKYEESGTCTHVSAYFTNLTAKSLEGIHMHTKLSFACLDGARGQKHKREVLHTSSSKNAICGLGKWLPLDALIAPSLILPDGALHVVASIEVESVCWLIEDATRLKLENIEGPTSPLDGATCKAVASSTMDEVTGDEEVIALASCDRHACSDNHFVLRTDFQICVSKNNVVLATNIATDKCVAENDTVSLGARVLPLLDATVKQANLQVAFAPTTKRTSVSWIIHNFRRFLHVAKSPSAVKSGQITVGGNEVQLTVYPQGNGIARHSHVSCFISVTTALDSDIFPNMEFSFSAYHRSGKTYSVATERVAVGKQPIGVARFISLNDVENFVWENGELCLSVSWRDVVATDASILPCVEEPDSGVDLIQHVLAAEKKWRDVRTPSQVSSLLGELGRAAQVVTAELSPLGAWDVPMCAADAIEACADTWTAYIAKQNKIPELLAGHGVTRDKCAQRNEARSAFCKAVDAMDAINSMNTLDALRTKDIPTVPDLEARFTRKTNESRTESAIATGMESLERWAEQKKARSKKLEKTGEATESAAQKVRDAIGCLFNTDPTFVFDEEECLRADCKALFPTNEVVEAYFAMKEKAATTKRRPEELWEDKERAVILKGEVKKWLAAVSSRETLTKREREGKQLMGKMSKLLADLFEVELEDDGPNRAVKEESAYAEMRSFVEALRKVDKARLMEVSDLRRVQQDHFPDTTELPPGPFTSKIEPFWRPDRFLDMYVDRKILHAGRHHIWRANFLGQPCVLKQFFNHVEMLREAEVQHRLRHRAVVPVEAIFCDAGYSYIQLPSYECDLVAWLATHPLDAATLRTMASHILLVVAHIHQCNLVHGDLKARHFLVDADFQLVLCDFGFSTTSDTTRTLPTKACMSGGTQSYLALELTQDRSNSSKATDMYSVGCIILNDLLPRCSGTSDELKGLRRLATACRSQDACKRPTAMAALAEMTHRPLSEFPAYWKTKGGGLSLLYNNTSYMEDQALRLLRYSCTHTGNEGCSAKRLNKAVIVKVERNENPILFRNYLRKKAEIAEYHRKCENVMMPIGIPLGKDKEWLIDPSVNECYLMHGTVMQNVSKILEDGLNEREANCGGLYGVGTYFASESCKAIQYCTRPLSMGEPAKPGEVYCILLCRVLVGDAYNTDKVFQPTPMSRVFPQYLRGPPARKNNARWDSVIAAPGKKKSFSGNVAHNQTHYETIVFDQTQIFPEYAIYFKIP